MSDSEWEEFAKLVKKQLKKGEYTSYRIYKNQKTVEVQNHARKRKKGKINYN